MNAMLSLGYTVFTNQVLAAVRETGLDPALGALHEVKDGRPSLACDLVEEYRPLIDRLTLTLTNRRLVRQEDFRREDGAVLLAPAAMRLFIAAVERLLDRSFPFPGCKERLSLRYGMLRQARELAASLKQGRKLAYEPFRML